MNTQKPIRRSGRPRKEEALLRRDDLLERAFRLFGDYGFGNLSLETIAREAQVSLRTIYSQYGGKAGLFTAAVRHYSDRFVGALPSASGAVTDTLEMQLKAFGEEYLYQVTRPELISLRVQILAEARRFPELALDFYTLGPKRSVQYLSGFFDAHQVEGRFAKRDSIFMAEQFLNALRGERYLRLQLGIEAAPSRKEIRLWVVRVVRLFLEGYEGQP